MSKSYYSSQYSIWRNNALLENRHMNHNYNLYIHNRQEHKQLQHRYHKRYKIQKMPSCVWKISLISHP
ncbi:hypothetical protein C2G38_2121997 [Gigaspora rosea]|uniref:Uncharacterized protein n=1 Tax=Gigaspora rosea TaxID=44941 RepID=A0A397U2L0_9GLOM|nr:hypothetical protein C2G38_2121997 [Gigaspora rosea]